MVPLPLLLPLLSGMVYVVGALLLKRASELGADVWRIARRCNFVAALIFAPLTLLGGTCPSWRLWWQPALVALLFTAGQVCSLLALNVGDVSVATPVLGVKIILVALLTTALIGDPIGPDLWTAVFLGSVAIALLNFSRSSSHHHVRVTILLAGLAATAYALFDVLVQKWVPAWGAGRFLPLTMIFAAICTPAIRPLVQRRGSPANPAPGSTSAWVTWGAVCLGLQSIMFICFIAFFGQATVANVLYASRGLWSVLAVWWIGHWFSNREARHGWRVLGWRLLGATLLLAAILVVFRGAH